MHLLIVRGCTCLKCTNKAINKCISKLKMTVWLVHLRQVHPLTINKCINKVHPLTTKNVKD